MNNKWISAILFSMAVGCSKTELPVTSESKTKDAVNIEAEKDSPQQVDSVKTKTIVINVDSDDYYPIDNSDEYPADYKFDEQPWVLVGYAAKASTPGLAGLMYSAGDRDERLVLGIRMISNNPESFDIMKHAYIQKRINNNWMNDGREEIEFRDGEKRIHYNHLGNLDGLSRVFYPSGQIKVSETYKNGKLNGRSRSWYRNGQLQTDIMYENGRELSAKSWEENGKER